MLSEDFINTKVIGLTRGMSLKRIKLLILRALDLDTCIPLMLNNEEFEKIAQILNQKSTISFELVDKLTQTFFISLEHLEIICKPYGEHEVYAYFSGGDHLRRLTLSLPLAVALAFHHNMPFRVHRSVFQRTALANEETNQMSFALNDMTEELLEEAESSAVAEDNYELATQLRNELRRRKSLKDGDFDE